ncbi:adenylate/guanylate cyclase domain-containing protein [bacterium]|nr:MAG: adenylate/guanylate cyclase domain-containing protein [bacterium]
MNKAVGLPKVSYTPPPPGGVVRQASIRFRGVKVAAWDEHPFDWVEGDHFTVRRVFHGGPFKSFEGGIRMKADGAGTVAEAHGDFVPRGALGRFLAPLVGGKGSADMAGAVAKVGAWACTGAGCDCDPLRPQTPKDTVDRTRLERLLGRAAERSDRAVLERLRRHIETADDQDAAVLRPFELADRWALDRLATLTAFLAATREGALDLRWELLCPHCRVAKSACGTLSEAAASAHCDFCNADFDAQLDVNMELRFSPNPSVRPVTAAQFCIGGPANSRHRPAQVKVAAGQTRVVTLPLKSRRYLVRGLLGTSEFLLLPDSAAGGSAAKVAFSGGEAAEGEAHFKPGLVELTLTNAGPEVWAVVEEVEWGDTAATAAFVTSLQDFKDLFSSEVLAPGTEVSVRSLALLFTDLKGSTAMYERVGDARAYSVVRDHFGVLFEVVRRRRGAVVKTIGDAVMAAFSDPADAVAAALEMHDELHARNKTLTVPVVLKVGVHEGPAIAINSSGVLDYFGTTVNLAARVQSESTGGDVVLTEAVLASARAAGLVKKTCECSADFETTVKGLAAPVRLTRVWPRSSLDAGLGPG